MRPLFPYLILLLFLLVFPVPVKAQPYELAYDDGTAEFGFVCTVGCIAAVKFSVNSSVQILKLRYFIWGETLPFRVHVLDSNFSSIFSQDVQPSSADPHWFEVDISGENVIVNGDFFVGLEWRKLYDEWPRPWLGADKTSPCKRSYLGSLSSPPVSPKEGENYLIRVVVQKAPDPPSLTIFEPQISDLIVTINGVTLPGHKGASITRIHWDWGDGSSEDSWFPASHRYNKPGKYTVTVTSYQSDGLSTTKTIKVQINEPPTAYIDSISPNPAYEGQTISFSGHGYDPDGKIAECDWRADGRVLSSSCSFSTSLSPGKYTIYFRVKDDKGAWSKWVTETLEVKAKQKEEIPKEGAEKLSELARGKSAFFRSLAEFIDKKTDPRKYLDQFASDLRNLGEFLGKPPENVEEASKKALKDFLLKIIDPNGVIDTADALGKISTVTAYAFMESADVNFWYVIWTNEPLKSDLKAVAEEMNKAASLYDEEANCWEGITKGKCDIDHLKNILNREKDQLIKLKATVNEKIENVLSVFRNPSPEVVLNDYKKVVEGDVLKYELPSPPYPCETVEISIEQVPKPAKNFWEFWITDPSYEIEIYPYYYYYSSSFQCQKDEKPLTSRPGACLVNRSLTYNTKSIFGSSMSVTWSVKDLYPLGTFEYDVLGLVIRVKDFGGDNTFTFWTDEGIKEAQIAVKMVYKSSGKYIQLYSFGAQQLENLRSNLITILDKYLDTINNTLTKL
jgi:hypothetical protein